MLGIAFAAASIAAGDAVAINVYWKKIKAFLGMSAAESADTKKPDDSSDA